MGGFNFGAFAGGLASAVEKYNEREFKRIEEEKNKKEREKMADQQQKNWDKDYALKEKQYQISLSNARTAAQTAQNNAASNVMKSLNDVNKLYSDFETKKAAIEVEDIDEADKVIKINALKKGTQLEMQGQFGIASQQMSTLPAAFQQGVGTRMSQVMNPALYEASAPAMVDGKKIYLPESQASNINKNPEAWTFGQDGKIYPKDPTGGLIIQDPRSGQASAGIVPQSFGSGMSQKTLNREKLINDAKANIDLFEQQLLTAEALGQKEDELTAKKNIQEQVNIINQNRDDGDAYALNAKLNVEKNSPAMVKFNKIRMMAAENKNNEAMQPKVTEAFVDSYLQAVKQHDLDFNNVNHIKVISTTISGLDEKSLNASLDRLQKNDAEGYSQLMNVLSKAEKDQKFTSSIQARLISNEVMQKVLEPMVNPQKYNIGTSGSSAQAFINQIETVLSGVPLSDDMKIAAKNNIIEPLKYNRLGKSYSYWNGDIPNVATSGINHWDIAEKQYNDSSVAGPWQNLTGGFKDSTEALAAFSSTSIRDMTEGMQGTGSRLEHLFSRNSSNAETFKKEFFPAIQLAYSDLAAKGKLPGVRDISILTPEGFMEMLQRDYTSTPDIMEGVPGTIISPLGYGGNYGKFTKPSVVVPKIDINGKPIMVEAKDENGKTLIDEKGQPVMRQSYGKINPLSLILKRAVTLYRRKNQIGL